jgi:hydroxyacylglutathione hydrolase
MPTPTTRARATKSASVSSCRCGPATITGIPGLHEPHSFFSPDPARNRESMRRLAELEPALVCFGHGRPLCDPARLKAFAQKLP